MNDVPKDPPKKPRHGDTKESGRVAFDARGNPVWEWKTDSGGFERNISTQRLRKLESQDLKLEDTQSIKKVKKLSLQEQDDLPGDGANPYESGGLKSSGAPLQTHPALRHKHSAKQNIGNVSLATKYAYAAKQKAMAKPRGFFDKLKRMFQRGK
jgi:hypothetical protein